MIFAELKKYVVANLGGKAWNQLLQQAGMPPRVFFADQVYPDADLVALVQAAHALTGKSVPDILEDFGAFIAPDLVRMYGPQINPEWKALDLIEHTEQLIHTNVRATIPGADPPGLVVRRASPDLLTILYRSPRKLCPVARGLARGMAAHYNEKVAITEGTCMLKGDKECTIQVQRLP